MPQARRALKRESKVQLSDEIIFFDDVAGNTQAKVRARGWHGAAPRARGAAALAWGRTRPRAPPPAAMLLPQEPRARACRAHGRCCCCKVPLFFAPFGCNDLHGVHGSVCPTNPWPQVELLEVVDFFRAPGKFKDSGARAPKGVLLVGPPGNGKTLMARCVCAPAAVDGGVRRAGLHGPRVGHARSTRLEQAARRLAPLLAVAPQARRAVPRCRTRWAPRCHVCRAHTRTRCRARRAHARTRWAHTRTRRTHAHAQGRGGRERRGLHLLVRVRVH